MCRTDPVEIFGSEHGEACIEVHHTRVRVGHLPADHATRLEDLQRLCGNCHRFVHRLLRRGLPVSNETLVDPSMVAAGQLRLAVIVCAVFVP
jgi:predicted HNH restriction endonuclease